MEGDAGSVEAAYERGLDLIRRGKYFEAHEALEEAWRAARPSERDFFQGLVHVAVAWYQAGRGNRVGCERQLAKAQRRLSGYRPAHRGLDLADLLAQVSVAERLWAGGDDALPAVQPRRAPPESRG
jgi:predicted metal-dependent hydrolase